MGEWDCLGGVDACQVLAKAEDIDTGKQVSIRATKMILPPTVAFKATEMILPPPVA